MTNRKEVDSLVDDILGFQVVFKFTGREEAYFAQLDKKTYERLRTEFLNFDTSEGNGQQTWFDTVDGLTVALNKKRVQWVEIGRDLDEPEPDRIRRQVLGEHSDDPEGGDDRLVRLFISGREYEDYPSPNNDHGLLVILHDALDGFLDQQELSHFEWDSGNDLRTVFFRNTDFELIEAPTAAIENYVKKIMQESGASPEEIEEAFPKK